MRRPERDTLLLLAHARFLRARERVALAAMLGCPEAAGRLSTADLARLLGRPVRTEGWAPARLAAAAERTARLAAAGTFAYTCWGDPGYPAALAEIHDPPAVLFHRGTPPDPSRTLVGVVGTRLPTGAGRDAAFRLGFELGRAGVGVVSGLARGVDREAHEGCSRTGGYSIAVLGCGPDLVVPAASRGAARRLLEAGGLLLAEYPPGTPPRAWHFPERNRIISGLARSVVVVEAPEGSGALYTADFALQEGRDLYVHAAGFAGATGAGTRALAEAGATVVRSAAGIFADWGWQERAAAAQSLAGAAAQSLAGAAAQSLAGAAAREPADGGRGEARDTAGAGAALARLAAAEIAGTDDARFDGTYKGA